MENKYNRDIKLSVFIIDDDAGDIKILKTILKSSDIKYDITEAKSDNEISGLLNNQSNHPDIIFLDYQMPGRGGMDWLSEIKEKNIAPVIILTGRGDEITAAESIKKGAFDYIPKDRLNSYELTKTIRNCLERWDIQNERDALLGIAAHELRNPLSTLLGYTEILSRYENLNRDKQKEIYSVLYERASHLQEIINRILDYSSIQKGKIQINLVQGDLLELVSEVISCSHIIAENKNIKLKLCTDLNACYCSFDKVRLEGVISNLIDNAIKYSPGDSVVNIHVEKTEDHARVSIVDQGQGIREEELKFLFKLFSNVKISSHPTAGEKSTGLGLAICKKIIDLHNGSIFVKSEIGKGSTFTFELPST